MKIFDKLTGKQLKIFSKILVESSLLHTEFIREKYLRSALNYDETTEFLKTLGLIIIQNGQMYPTPKFEELLKSVIRSSEKESVLKNFIGHLILERTNPYYDYIIQFLKHFNLGDGQIKFKPDRSFQRLGFSGIRNFLIDINVIRLDSDNVTYIVNDNYYEYVKRLIEECGITPEELIKLERKNQEIGLKAELRIIEYEKERLSAYPWLIEKIEHVARKNVLLGYDIKSYEGIPERSDNIRLIEVKAVSLSDYGFNWTRNEMEKSKTEGNQYYLYLLPVLKKNEFNIEKLKIIQDPYRNILNSEQWMSCCESLSLKMKAT